MDFLIIRDHPDSFKKPLYIKFTGWYVFASFPHPGPFSLFLSDLYLLVSSLSSLLVLLWREHSLNTKTVTAEVIPLLSAEDVDNFVGSRTILIDTHGNYRRGRQQTVVVQGQHKTINHNSSFCPPERIGDHAQPKSNSANMCLHICLHQLLAYFGPPWLNFALPWRSNKDCFSLVWVQ